MTKTIFRIKLQGQPDEKPEIALYAFSTGGGLVAAAAVKDEKAELALPAERAGSVRLLIGPASFLQENRVTVEALERANAFEPAWRFNPKDKIQELPPIAEALWKFWPLCFCRVRGRVLHSCANAQERPVPFARVHICEVDALPRIILRLPDDVVFRLRDDLLKRLEVIPIPRPIPDPGPLVPVMSPSILKRVSRLADAPQASATLPMEAKVALASNSAAELRRVLVDHIDWIKPHLCFWPWIWVWFRCDEIRVVETNINGNFDTVILYNCLGDHPDIYLWVEYYIDGEWVTVYRPSVPCHTHWNYVCGSELVIHLTDPRIPCIAPDPLLTGQTVLVRQVGNIDTTGITAEGRIALAGGGAAGGAAFGGSLEPIVNFASEGLKAAGITYYRWSYRRLTRANGTTTIADSWHHMNQAVAKRFVQFLPGLALQYVPVSLGPDPAHPGLDLFRIPPSIPAELDPANIGWAWLDNRNDRASAYFSSTAADRTGETVLDPDGNTRAAGLFALKLELFKNDGTRADLPRGSYAIESGVVLPTLSNADQTALESGAAVLPTISRLVEVTGGKESAFVLVLRVDNYPTEADIQGVAIVGDSTDRPCGMLPYGADPSRQVRLAFTARHPQGFASFALHTYKGRMGEVLGGSPVATHFASTSGWVNGPLATTLPNGFLRDADADIHKDVSAQSLLTANGLLCESAAFALRLDVWSQITDGYARVGHDSYDGEAFALIP